MIVDRLVVHHTYSGSTAVDVSQNHHHGRLEGVTLSGGAAEFGGGPDAVRVLRSPILDHMRAVRTSVRFKAPLYMQVDPWSHRGGPPRLYLIEGYLSFALVIAADRALHGTIRDRSGTWNGVSSDPGAVSFGEWHEATFLHDGFSACALSLDGATLGTAYDVLGPVSPPRDPYGVAIGHWPDPDDRYSFVGQITDVKVWIDRPEELGDLVDDCCMDRELAGELFDALRGEAFDNPDFDPVAYDNAAQTMLDLGSKTAGAMASGSQAERQYVWDLGARFRLAHSTGNRDAFVQTLAEGVQHAASKIPESQLNADSTALLAALQPTLLGPIASAVAGGESSDRVSYLTRKLGLDDWMTALCAGWALPTEPKEQDRDHDDRDRDDTKTDDRGDRTGPETTDRDPSDLPPGWGFGTHDETPPEPEADDAGGERARSSRRPGKDDGENDR